MQNAVMGKHMSNSTLQRKVQLCPAEGKSVGRFDLRSVQNCGRNMSESGRNALWSAVEACQREAERNGIKNLSPEEFDKLVYDD